MIESIEGDPNVIAKTGLYYRVWEGADDSHVRPIVVLVHGRAGNADVMWIFAKVARFLNAVIVAPQAPIQDQIGGWSWWRIPSDDPHQSANTKATPEEIVAQAHILGNFIDEVRTFYNRNHIHDQSSSADVPVYAMGFSQGGALIGTLALENRSMFKKVALLASFIPRAILELWKGKAGELRLPPFFFFHGTRDQIVTLERAKAAADTLTEMGADVTFSTDDVGHKVSSNGIRSLEEWLQQ